MGIQITGQYRGRTQTFIVDTTPLDALDVSDDLTLERWCALPEWDDRTLSEFAASGGARIAPPGSHPCSCAPPPSTPASRKGVVVYR